MLASLLLAAATAGPALGVWPSSSGPPAATVKDVEVYVTEPEEDYWILAVQPLPRPLEKAEEAELERLAALARKLGGDAVILLGELQEKNIPEKLDEELPAATRIGTAVFITFDCACEDEGKGSRPAIHRPRHGASHRMPDKAPGPPHS